MSAPPKCAITRLCTQSPVSRVGTPLSPLATTSSHLPVAPLSFNQVLLAAQPTLCSLFLDVGCVSFRVLLWMGLGLRVNLGLQADGHL